MYAVKHASSQFEESFWCPSATAAFNNFRQRESLPTGSAVSALAHFGFQSLSVQTHLFALRSPKQLRSVEEGSEEKNAKKTRGAMAKQRFKDVVKRVVAQQHREKLSGFGDRAAQAVVQGMLTTLEGSHSRASSENYPTVCESS